MTSTDYKAILEQAKKDLLHEQEELGCCLKKQEETEKKIVALRQTVSALSRMLDEEFVEEDAMGLTDAIRQIFVYTVGTLIPTEVRDRLEESGYDIKKYGNVMASVHSVINRLKDRKEIVEAGSRADGKVSYRWNGEIKVRISAPNAALSGLGTHIAGSEESMADRMVRIAREQPKRLVGTPPTREGKK